MKKNYLYSARDTSTGKLVSDITSPGKKYWQKKDAAQEAINKYNFGRNYYGRRNNHGRLELVTWELIEVSSDNSNKEVE